MLIIYLALPSESLDPGRAARPRSMAAPAAAGAPGRERRGRPARRDDGMRDCCAARVCRVARIRVDTHEGRCVVIQLSSTHSHHLLLFFPDTVDASAARAPAINWVSDCTSCSEAASFP